jgi:hypothetical protein
MILPAINTILSGRLFSKGGKKREMLAKFRTEYHKGRPEYKWEHENAKAKLGVVRRPYLAWVSAQLRCLVQESSIANSGSTEAEKILNNCVSISFSKMALLLCVFT